MTGAVSDLDVAPAIVMTTAVAVAVAVVLDVAVAVAIAAGIGTGVVVDVAAAIAVDLVADIVIDVAATMAVSVNMELFWREGRGGRGEPTALLPRMVQLARGMGLAVKMALLLL